MSEDLEALWAQSKPQRGGGENLEALWEQSAPKERVSAGRAGVLGVAQGGTAGFVDELGGLIGKAVIGEGVKLGRAAQPSANDSPAMRRAKEEELLAQAERPSTYQLTRNLIRDEARIARKEHPETFIPGEVVGSVGLGAVTGGGSLPAVLAQGAVAGAGHSEASDLQGIARDTEAGMKLAGIAHGATSLAGAGVRGLRNWAGGKVAGEEAAALARGRIAAAAESNSARGALGGEVQKGNRIVENIDRLDPYASTVQRSLGAVQQPLREDLARKLLNEGMNDLPGQAARIAEKEAAYRAALAGEEELAQRLAREELQGGAMQALKMAGRKYVPELVGPRGMAAWRLSREVLQSPKLRYSLFQAIQQGAVKAEQLGPYAAALFTAASRGQGVFDEVAQAVAQRE